MWLKYVWHSSFDYIYGPHGYFRLVFWPNLVSFKAKKILLKKKSPKHVKKFLLEVLDCNDGGPGRVLDGKNGLEGDS